MSSVFDPNYQENITAAQTDIDELNINDSINKTIHLPEELYDEIIMWIDRIELGERVSLVNRKFFRISFPFMHLEKQHNLSNLSIYGGNHKPWMEVGYANGSWKIVSKLEEVPTVEIAENIIAKKNHLKIRGLDNKVLHFVRLLAPIYTSTFLCLRIEPESKLSKPDMKELIGLFSDKIRRLYIGPKIHFAEFFKHYAVLMENLFYIGIKREMTMQEFDVLMKWLCQARDDKKPKIVDIWTVKQEFIEVIKEDFSTANRSVSFFIIFKMENIDQNLLCNIVNFSTNERLTIQQPFAENGCLIARMSQNCLVSPVETVRETADCYKKNLSIVNIEVFEERKQKKKSGSWKCILL